MTDTKSSDDVIAVSREMPPSASKTPSPEKEIVPANQKKRKPPPTLGKSLVGLCKIAAKHLPLVVGVYAMGYFNFSIAWILGIVGITAATDQWRKERNYRMSTARASALYSDKDVIMARVSDLPSWVFFPDFDRAEWLNKILKQVWPNVGHYVRNIILEAVQPGIRESLKAYKLGGFKMDKISLGTMPFRVGGVKVYDKNVSRNEIVMDMDICYAGDCDIRFSIKGLKGGIKDFQMSGMLRVIMKPLISQIPLFGGIQIFFLNSPSVDFNLIGVVDVLDMPGLNGILRRVIIEQIGAFLVLPNKLSFTLSDVVSPIVVKIPEPSGVLRVRVIEAKQLMKMDRVLGIGKSDPYAIITVGSQEFRTKTIYNTVNPKWDFYCEYVVSERRSQLCFLRMFDRDETGGEDDPLGKATIDIYSIAKAGKKDMWVTLEDVKSGMIHLELTWFSLMDDPVMLKMHAAETQSMGLSSALLIVYVDSATSLPSARTSSKPDPYVIVTAGNRSEQTSARMRTCDPTWEQALVFLVCNPESDDLYLKVMDQKTGGELGGEKITLVSLLTLPNMELSHQPLSLKNSGPESKLIVSIRLKVMVPGQPMEGNESILDTGDFASDPPLPSTPPPSSSDSMKAKPEPKSDAPGGNDMQTSASGSSSSAAGDTISLGGRSEQTSLLDKSMSSSTNTLVSAAKLSLDRESNSSIRRRQKGGLPPGVVSQVQLTLRYSSQRQRLIIVVHKVSQLPGGDQPDPPDPYVKLYLLPDRSTNSKRKTEIVKDTVNPVFDETFEYTVVPIDLPSRELEVSVINRKGRFARSPLMCSCVVILGHHDLTQAVTQWFEMKPSE
ncbi:extended synaptotagmin-2-like isoform X2 [Daphnia pulex]|uniref:extended synaptotagmin-2-like isoform X2 n=1 Tax=Daphnia pulex TaxID=6669 RepID=UPI001EE13FB0|nr:extended synaptotagmin-2-like isoform X2 [Daphnia pulex]XP_046456809.1 extended synaptotagmin-2-like isoform X2 [Daphnia pulex]